MHNLRFNCLPEDKEESNTICRYSPLVVYNVTADIESKNFWKKELAKKNAPSYLVTENFDLAEGTVDGLIAAVIVAVCVNLNHQRKALHSFLGREVCAQAVHGDENLFPRKRS